jgi:hypothetical protein
MPSCSVTPALVAKARAVFVKRTAEAVQARGLPGEPPSTDIALLAGYGFEAYQQRRDILRQREFERHEVVQRQSQPRLEYLLRRSSPVTFEVWETQTEVEPSGEVLAVRIRTDIDDSGRMARLSFGDWHVHHPVSGMRRTPRNEFWVQGDDKDWAQGFVQEIRDAFEPAFRPTYDRLRSLWAAGGFFGITLVLILVVGRVWDSDASGRVSHISIDTACDAAVAGILFARAACPVFEWFGSGKQAQSRVWRGVVAYFLLLLISVLVPALLGWFAVWIRSP